MNVEMHEMPVRSKFRYFVSVGGKVSTATALAIQITQANWTRNEALNKVALLRKNIEWRLASIAAAEQQALNYDSATNRHMVKLQKDGLAELLSYYSHEIPQVKEVAS